MTRRVPFLDPSAGYRELRAELDAAYRRVIDGGIYIMGEELEAFERAFAARCAVGHAIGVGNGLDALALGLRAAGIGPADEVIVPAQTFIASWLAVTRVGATPVPAEIDPATVTLDPAAAAAAVTERTAAVMPVHLFGQAAAMPAFIELGREHGLFVLEDAAQAHGATLHGRVCGSWGDAAGFSFYPGKNLGAFGDGGALVTGDGALAATVRSLRNYGSSVRYVHDELGENSRLDPLQAAFLAVKLSRLAAWNERRRVIAATYLEALAGLEWLTLPHVAEGSAPVWHLFVIRCAERDALQCHLDAAGIGTLIHYPTVPYLSGAYASMGLSAGAFPAAEAAAARSLSLPIGPHLADDDVARVIEAIRAYSPTA